MQKWAQELDFGLYVVRNTFTPKQCADWHAALQLSLNDLAVKHGVRCVQLKGNAKILWYHTIQCVTGGCTCKYDYAATARNFVFPAEFVQPFPAVLDWVHSQHQVRRQNYFDQFVANVYSRASNQSINAHSDQNPLLGDTADILSLSMGSAGLFYWQPNDKKG